MDFCALGVDVGSTNTKVALIGADSVGVVRELALRSVPTSDDVPTLLEAIDAGIRDVLGAAQAVPDVVGIASMAETGVPLGADGTALTPLLRWNSGRGGRDADTLGTQLGAADLFEATGVPPGPKVPLATWLWLRRTEPNLFARMTRWAGAADLVCVALTGRLVTDHTLAARTMAYRLPRPGEALAAEFDDTLLGAVGLDASRLPHVAQPGDTAGEVTADAARRTGLGEGTPVVIAGHDHAVGAWAAGARQPGDAADSLGTAEALVRVLSGHAGTGGVDREAVRAAGMSLSRTVTGEHQSLIAGMAGTGSLMRWWFDNLLDGADAEAVFAAVDALPPGPGDLLVLPYSSGRQSPSPDASARLRILDERGTTAPSHAELTRGLLEGLSLQLRWMDTEQRRLAGDDAGDLRTRRIRVLGGAAARNSTWLRIKAAVMPTPLALTTAKEPVAAGAALLAAVRLGVTPNDAVLAHVEVAAGADGAPDGAAYAAAFRDFVSAATELDRVAER